MLSAKRFPSSWLLAALALGAPSLAQCELQHISPAGIHPSNGWKVAQDGETFAVAGDASVHVYRQDGRTAYEVQELPMPGSGIHTLVLDGSVLAVATRGTTGFDKSVLLFEYAHGEWFLSDELHPRTGEFHFGRALALDGRLLAIASYEPASLPLPVVYVYERVPGAWLRVARLTPPGRIDEGFGGALDLDGERLAVGVVGITSTQTPHAYVFERTGADWVRHDVTSSLPAPRGFGAELDLRGEVLLVGRTSARAGGIAQLFEYDGVSWRESSELVTEDGLDVPSVAEVAIADDELVLVGAPWNDERRQDGGAVYFFEQVAGAWRQSEKVFPATPATQQGFGASLACDGDLAILGALHGEGVRTFSVRETRCRTLSAWPPEISLTQGGRQTLRLDPGREHAGRTYWLLGSASGFDPGFRFRGMRVPLVPDAYLASSLPGRRGAPFVNNVGVVGTRTAVVTIDVPAGLDLALTGLTLHHAFLVLDHGVVKHVSNFRTLTLVP